MDTILQVSKSQAYFALDADELDALCGSARKNLISEKELGRDLWALGKPIADVSELRERLKVESDEPDAIRWVSALESQVLEDGEKSNYGPDLAQVFVLGIRLVEKREHPRKQLVSEAFLAKPVVGNRELPAPHLALGAGLEVSSSLIPRSNTVFPVAPAPVNLPVDWAEASKMIRDAIHGVLESIDIRDFEISGQDSYDKIDMVDNWRRVDDFGLGMIVSPYVGPVLQLVEQAANESLVSFVAEKYRIHLQVNRIDYWDPFPTIEIGVRWIDEPEHFSIDDAAEGLKLWIQLALMEATSVVSGWPDLVELGSHQPADDEGVFGHNDPEVTSWASLVHRLVDPDDEAAAILEEYGEHVPPQPIAECEFANLSEELTGIWAENSDSNEVRLKSEREMLLAHLLLRGLRLFQPRQRPSAAPVAAGPRIYFMDEPERHLNPRLAREAALWLEGFFEERAAQAIIASHSPPFLGLSGADYLYTWRVSKQMNVRAFDVSEITALDHVASEVGFDRGELLSSVSLFLFVEGRADQIVLETLYGSDLRRLGAVVVPVHGVFKFSGIIEAEVLWRFTAAEAVVLVDNNVANRVREIQFDAEARREARSQRSNTELQQIANLLETAIALERDVTVLSIPTFDMFGVLDEDLLMAKFPDFPGHASAKAAWEDNQPKGGKNGMGLKAYLRERYRVDLGLETFEEIATQMALEGKRPHSLTAIMASLSSIVDSHDERS